MKRRQTKSQDNTSYSLGWMTIKKIKKNKKKQKITRIDEDVEKMEP